MNKTVAFERGKNKNIIVFLFFAFLVSVFFVPKNFSLACEKLVINELMTGSPENNNDEFIEIYNPTDFDSDTSNCSIQYRGGSGISYSKKNFGTSNPIPSYGYFLIAHGNDYSGTTPYDMSWSQSFSESGGTIFLVNSKEYLNKLETNTTYLIDKLGYGEAKEFEQEPAIKPSPGQSISRKNFIDSNNNLKDFIPSLPSPKKITIELPEEEEKEEELPTDDESDSEQNYSSDIRLNEIMANPKGDEKVGEFIELYNADSFSIDLKGWILKDASKTKFIFPSQSIIKADSYLTIYRSEFKFALNNTGLEDVFLLNPSGELVSEASYDGAKENISFSFDGSDWRWTTYLTPGKNNRFGASSKIKADKIKEGYVGVPVEFSLAPGYDSFSKVTWEFGDKKKSYLKNPKHIYLKKGSYKINVSASGETENVSDSFVLKIKDYPREKIEIVGLIPNPFGSDSGQEWIELKNNESDTINLKGWKIATGQKSLINHLIKTDFEIGPGESRQITREDTFFTLHNKGMTLELRYPDGKTADKVIYAKEKIADDEIYLKEAGQWIWLSAEDDSVSEEVADTETVVLLPTTSEDPIETILKSVPDEGKLSISKEWQAKKKNKLLYLAYGLTIKTALASSETDSSAFQNSINTAPHQSPLIDDGVFLKLNSFFNMLFF